MHLDGCFASLSMLGTGSAIYIAASMGSCPRAGSQPHDNASLRFMMLMLTGQQTCAMTR